MILQFCDSQISFISESTLESAAPSPRFQVHNRTPRHSSPHFHVPTTILRQLSHDNEVVIAPTVLGCATVIGRWAYAECPSLDLHSSSRSIALLKARLRL
jgi:hypothetical protein